MSAFLMCCQRSDRRTSPSMTALPSSIPSLTQTQMVKAGPLESDLPLAGPTSKMS